MCLRLTPPKGKGTEVLIHLSVFDGGLFPGDIHSLACQGGLYNSKKKCLGREIHELQLEVRLACTEAVRAVGYRGQA